MTCVEALLRRARELEEELKAMTLELSPAEARIREELRDRT